MLINIIDDNNTIYNNIIKSNISNDIKSNNNNHKKNSK